MTQTIYAQTIHCDSRSDLMKLIEETKAVKLEITTQHDGGFLVELTF